MSDGYIMLVTYNYSTGYISVPCATEKEGIEMLNEYLDREKRAVERNLGYTPVIRKHADTEAELFYIDDHGRISAGTDTATYRVVGIRHCAGEAGDGVKTWIVGISDLETETVKMEKFAGTKQQVGKHLLEIVKHTGDRNGLSFWFGNISVDDIEEKEDGSLRVTVYSRLIVQAYPEDDIPGACV